MNNGSLSSYRCASRIDPVFPFTAWPHAGRPKTAAAMTPRDTTRVAQHNLRNRNYLGGGSARRTAAATATLRRRQRQQRQRRPKLAVTVTVGRTTAAEAAGLREFGKGPRLWGPEDWGEDAPTMAMLTEPVLRRGKTAEREEGERPGPIWRATFGGSCG